MIDYYTRVAPALLPHLRGRPLTLKRYPDGVEGPHFYEKQCPSHRPDWVRTAAVDSSRARGGKIDFCLADDLPTLVWLANLADLELHTSLAHGRRLLAARPCVAFDLDPGAPATIVECAEVALELRTVFEHLGMEAFPKTSGSKGMQVYVPLNTPVTYRETSPFAKGLAQLLERRSPKARGLGDEQVAAQGPGVRRLEPELAAQDDGLRVLAAGAGAADRLDPAALGGGRGGHRVARSRGPRVHRAPRCSSAWPSTATCSRRCVELEQRLPDAL